MPLDLLTRERRFERLMGLPARRRPTPYFSKEAIVGAYRQLVEARGGKVVGQRPFMRQTGIPACYWRGRYWPSWSALQADLGFTPNQRLTKIPMETLLRCFAELALELNRFPTQKDLERRHKQDRSFPSSNPFGLVRRDELLIRLEAWCKDKREFAPVLRLLDDRRARIAARRRDDSTRFQGIVYLARPGESFAYQIGSLRARGMTLRRAAARMGCLPGTIHVIDTDDPEGIEFYWRRRFRSKRLGRNLYRLLPEDLTAFRWRKFQ